MVVTGWVTGDKVVIGMVSGVVVITGGGAVVVVTFVVVATFGLIPNGLFPPIFAPPPCPCIETLLFAAAAAFAAAILAAIFACMAALAAAILAALAAANLLPIFPTFILVFVF